MFCFVYVAKVFAKLLESVIPVCEEEEAKDSVLRYVSAGVVEAFSLNIVCKVI